MNIYYSKVTEKAVACQLTDYLNAKGLQEMFQSAYKVAHSTETALLKVQSGEYRKDLYWVQSFTPCIRPPSVT